MTAPAGNRWTCEQCGCAFARQKSGNRPIRFCNLQCYHAWNRAHGSGAGRFSATHRPWNKDLKGIHLSPATEFKKGRKSNRLLPVGSTAIRACKNGALRAFVKVGEPNKWRERAKVVWEEVNGPLPKGLLIHHRDRNTLNDDIENLEAMTRAEHLAEHREEHLAIKRANFLACKAASVCHAD